MKTAATAPTDDRALEAWLAAHLARVLCQVFRKVKP